MRAGAATVRGIDNPRRSYSTFIQGERVRLKKFASISLTAAVVCAFGAVPSYANTPAKVDAKAEGAAPAPDPAAAERQRKDERVKSATDKLLAKARGDTAAPIFDPQVQPARGNSLSKGTKIATGVGIAVVVIVAIVIATADHGPSGGIRIF